jgi:hypothetical protein
MAKVTEYSDSDDEAEAKEREEKEKRSMLNEKGEQMDFTEMMKKAAEMKTAQLKEKRRQWDATPDWYKNTMVISCPTLRHSPCHSRFICS